jgi:hypothetical protein
MPRDDDEFPATEAEALDRGYGDIWLVFELFRVVLR